MERKSAKYTRSFRAKVIFINFPNNLFININRYENEQPETHLMANNNQFFANNNGFLGNHNGRHFPNGFIANNNEEGLNDNFLAMELLARIMQDHESDSEDFMGFHMHDYDDDSESYDY